MKQHATNNTIKHFNMRNKIFTLFFAFLASTSLWAQSGTCGDNLTWSLVNGVLTISGSGDMTNYSYIAPWNQYTSSINTIVIGDSVTSIGNSAFYNCSGLTSITIPNSVTSIGEATFSGCTSLTAIIIPNSVTSIGYSVFSGCTSLTSITIPNSVTSIGYSVFSGCTSLTSITIPNSVTVISHSAFYNCTSLNSVTIPSSVISIGDNPFRGCSGLTSIVVESGNTAYDSRGNCNAVIETATNKLIAGCRNTIIPTSVTSIGIYAFENCSGLTSVTIPNSVTSIGEAAFIYCSGLTSVTIPNSVTSIGNGAFCCCWGLTSITIPNSVTSIGSSAFSGCYGLNSITISNSVTSIGSNAFSGCYGLTSITIPNSVSSIGDYAFYDCVGLTSVFMMPTTPPTLGYNAFKFNATNRVFVLTGCSYDDYYASKSWSNYRNYLREQTINININVFSDNTQYGIVGIQQLRGHNVRCDSTAVIYANANNSYHFDHWSNGNTANPDTIMLTGDSTLTAFFECDSHTVSVSVNDVSLGTVTYPYGNSALYGDTLAIVAQPAEHYHVASWSGDGIVSTSADKDTVRVSMTMNREILCSFAIDTLMVDVEYDSNRGNVTGGGEYVYGTPCTLEAFASTGFTFSNWSNGITANPYIFAVTESTKLTAIFESVSGIEEVTSIGVKPQKVWSDGQLYILLPNGTRYDSTGKKVE